MKNRNYVVIFTNFHAVSPFLSTQLSVPRGVTLSVSEIIPAEPDQGNACAGKDLLVSLLLSAFPSHYFFNNSATGRIT